MTISLWAMGISLDSLSSGGEGSSLFNILLEDGFDLLTESGDYLVQEAAP